jgi:pyruvate/2-oxoacid:ferredoxin oxidoreductase alpha subunit
MEIAPDTVFPQRQAGEISLTTWDSVAAGDTCTAFVLSVYSDRVVQVEGVFGGASVALQGSNDGVNYHTLTDPQGNALSFAAGGLETVMELPYYIKPLLSGGDGTTNLTITLSGRRSF